ncbi:MAG: 4Fe-4S dicluster domain-containing protein [Candidatus Aminicenantes bacterium]|nr:4Fe-4S dicluster domain-containing protein [Candidatus Aminicenantes bacterium]
MHREPIKVSKLDSSFRSEVLKHKDASGLNACFACGTCTAGCPVHEIFPEYSPRKLAKMVKLGMRKEVLSSRFIWYCTTCHNCEQHCPQNVKFFNILNVLKNMAAKEGHAPSPWVEQTRQIMQTGLIFPVDETLSKKRESFFLPALKTDGKKAKRIIELAGLDKIEAKK